MRQYSFSKQNIDLLNDLIFDSSIDISESYNSIILNERFTLNIERRVFEDVSRKKILFFNKTFIKGSFSNLIIYPVYNIRYNMSSNSNNLNNDFINNLTYNEIGNIININTIHNANAIELHVNDAFNIILVDISESDFGKGICFGKVGYTIKEWDIKYNNSK